MAGRQLLLLASATFLVSSLAGLVSGAPKVVDPEQGCLGYYDSTELWVEPIECPQEEFCCGECNDRMCCSANIQKLDGHEQGWCKILGLSPSTIAGVVAGVLLFVAICVVVCCFSCSCCVIRQMMNISYGPVLSHSMAMCPGGGGGMGGPGGAAPPRMGGPYPVYSSVPTREGSLPSPPLPSLPPMLPPPPVGSGGVGGGGGGGAATGGGGGGRMASLPRYQPAAMYAANDQASYESGYASRQDPSSTV
ncbi:uncharacterized protein LOC116938673 [Petromyzon marinus]|uniref:uncharacterized protein LOC116938673 n=1 Tax=Petromyzon marinus TaxID=7757 RepID=UPI003F6F6D7C